MIFAALQVSYKNKDYHYSYSKTIKNNKIKRSRTEDGVSHGFNMSKKNKPSGSQKENPNYFHPLQTVDDENEDETVIDNSEQVSKVKIPPITILKCKVEQLHEMCRILSIKNYSIRKISIGLKLYCTSIENYNTVCEKATKQFSFEHFTYGNKNDKPFKAILLGLDKQDPLKIKRQLVEKGLKCTDVKIVTRKQENREEQIIYVVYFERKTITMKELRENYSSLEYMKVKWEYQKPGQNKLTQCHNCQMFGHGSSRCKVKTFCAHCAGNHKSTECKENFQKCANCGGEHKALSPQCPSRHKYLEIRERSKPKRIHRNYPNFVPMQNYNENFPNPLNQGTPQTNNWSNIRQTEANNANLFSIDELKNLTFELISKLRNCKTRFDQFEVITGLAFKFLH